jgi:hypothetical protein
LERWTPRSECSGVAHNEDEVSNAIKFRSLKFVTDPSTSAFGVESDREKSIETHGERSQYRSAGVATMTERTWKNVAP